MSSPCHIDMICTEKEKIVPKPEEDVAQKKNIPEETGDTKAYGQRVNSAYNKCK